MDKRKLNENTYIGNKMLDVVDGKMGEDALQTQTDYLPTGNEQKILDALLDPANKYKNVTDLCQAAGVSRQAYYTAFKKPEFEDLYRKLTLGLVRQSVAPVVNSFLKEAVRGSYQHGKVLLEMAEMYREGGLAQTQGPSTINIMVMPQPEKPRELQVVEVIPKSIP